MTRASALPAVATLAAAACLLGGTLPDVARAHPGAIAEGRGSCGDEFASVQTAFVIHDIKEAWYVRRVATCEKPFFWVTYDTTEKDQMVTTVVQSPEKTQYADKLQFNAIRFGPVGKGAEGANGCALTSVELPDALKGIDVPANTPAVYLGGPKGGEYDSCRFVDNPVMKNYAEVDGGRCMEKLTFAADWKDNMVANSTWRSWWLASQDHRIPKPGKYYLLVWMSERGDSAKAPVSGSVEMTLGPWSWGGYASTSLKAKVQAQTTTCSCATNSPAWFTQNLEHLGNPPQDLFTAQLPFTKCSDASLQTTGPLRYGTACRASAKSPVISKDSSVEWAGTYDLEQSTYTWKFYAFKNFTKWIYPDATMDLVFVKVADTSLASLDGAQKKGDEELTKALNKSPQPIIAAPGATISLPDSAAGTAIAVQVKLVEPAANAANKYVSFAIDSKAKGSWALFTQHRPGEFLAEHITAAAGSKAIAFWVNSRTYGVEKNHVESLSVRKGPPTDCVVANAGAASDKPRAHMLMLVVAGVAALLAKW